MKKISAFFAACLLIGGALWMGDTRTREKINGAVSVCAEENVPFTFPFDRNDLDS